MAKISIQPTVTNQSTALDTKLMSENQEKIFDRRSPRQQAEYCGFGQNNRQNFDVPNFISRGSEQSMQKGNAFVVLGTDRNSDIFSGYGYGSTHAAAVDIVAGRLGCNARATTRKGDPVNADPNFRLDAARVYISQRSDPDGYFGLCEGSFSTSKKSPRSTVALKADTLRFIARENVKIITRTDELNSQGAPLGNAYAGNYGIDLIALNDDKGLQPLVKGENLVECLKEVIESVHDLRGLFDNFLDYNRSFMTAVIKHTHNSPFFGSLSSPAFMEMQNNIQALIDIVINVQLQMNSQMQKLNSAQMNYLEAPGGAVATEDGKSKFILSRYNNTN